jgi:hypothetical protein
MCDRRWDLRNITSEAGISIGSVQEILTDVYGMSKVPLDWSPDSWLTTRTYQACHFKIFFVSLRGWTWFYLQDRISGWNMGPSLRSRIQKQSVQWKHPGSPKKLKNVPSWLSWARSYHKRYVLCRQIETSVSGKRVCKERQTDSRRSDPVRQCASSHIPKCDGCCNWLRFRNSSPSPIFSGLSLSDFYLFPKLKTKLRGRRFWSNEGAMESVNEFIEDQNRQFYFEGLNKLEHRWAKCRGRLYWKVRPLVGFSDYRKYIRPRTFWSIRV